MRRAKYSGIIYKRRHTAFAVNLSMFYKLENILIDAPMIKAIVIIDVIYTNVLFVVFMLFVFVSTNMKHFYIPNVKPMLRNCYQIVNDKFNV